MKRGLMIAAIGLALTGFVIACVPVEDEPETLSAAERQSCTAAGGQVLIAGLSGSEFCATRTPDAGKMCHKASDCSTRCDAETRTCATYANPFGCYSYLNEQGQEESICVD